MPEKAFLPPLERRLEPDQPPDFRSDHEGFSYMYALNRPLPHQKTGDWEQTEVKAEKDPLALSYSYQPINPETFPSEITKYLQGQTPISPAYSIKELRNWHLQAGAEQLDLLELLPPETVVYLLPQINISSFYIQEARAVCITEDMTSPSSILTLLHEIGHAWQRERLSQIKESLNALQDPEQKMTEEQMRLVIDQERQAWAYALAKIKPFLQENSSEAVLPKAGVLDYIHHYSLRGYSRGIREKISLGLAEIEDLSVSQPHESPQLLLP